MIKQTCFFQLVKILFVLPGCVLTFLMCTFHHQYVYLVEVAIRRVLSSLRPSCARETYTRTLLSHVLCTWSANYNG